jgi:hypothetical protein
MYETMNKPEGNVQVSMLKHVVHILTTGLVQLEGEKSAAYSITVLIQSDCGHAQMDDRTLQKVSILEQ